MKLLKSLTVGLLAVAAAGTASAQTATTIHIAGSTAFRAAATAAIIDYLSNTPSPGTTVHAGIVSNATSGSVNQSILGAGASIMANGNLPGGTATTGLATIVVETYWTGSLAGVVDVTAGNNTGAYLDVSKMSTAQINTFNSSVVTGGTSTAYGINGGGALGAITTITSAPDAAFSDSYQGTIGKELATGTLTGPIGSYSSITSLATATEGSTIVDAGSSGNAGNAGGTFGFVGIVPFEVVIGNIADTTIQPAISNLTQQALVGLLGSGYVAQSYLTGTATSKDTANYFYWVGRNEDSGTRIAYLSESQYGVTTAPVQFQVTGSPVTSIQKYPITALNTESNIVWNTNGHSGYASGSNVSGALGASEPSSITFGSNGGAAPDNSGASYLISSLGITDALTAIGAGGKGLSYAGVPYSVAAVENGQYTLWTYEHLYRLASVTGTALSTLNGIADTVYNTDADIIASSGLHGATSGQSAGILDNSSSPVLVYRGAIEGGPISSY